MSSKHVVPGVAFGRYTITAELGRGAMGAVFLATHGELHKRVALKILHPHVAENPLVRERFKREGLAAAELDHPNVVNALDAGELDGVPFLVMEYLEGKTLGKLLAEQRAAGRCLSPAQAAELLLPVMDGLAFAHEAEVVHRDLKPENIFLARLRNGRVEPKILDFGVARVRSALAEHTLTAEGSLLGTPAYMSPEQVTDTKNVDARSDQYSITAVLYECVTGHRPIEIPPEATLQRILNTIAAGVVTPPRARCPTLGDSMEALLLRGLAGDPSRRFGSVRELADALRAEVSIAGERASMSGLLATPSVPPAGSVMGTLPLAAPPEVAVDTTVNSSAREIVAPPPPSSGGAKRTALVALAGVAMVGGAVALLVAAVATREGDRAALPSQPAPHAAVVQATPVTRPEAPAVVRAIAAPRAAPAAPVRGAPAAPVTAPPPRAVAAPAVVAAPTQRPTVAVAPARGGGSSRRRPEPRGAWGTVPTPTHAPSGAVPLCNGVPCPD